MKKKYEPMMRLKLRRVEKGLTQKELADMVGIGQGFISDYETGRYFPRKKVLAELFGKRFILASETEEGQRLSTSMLKQIASVDSIAGEKKYRDPFTFVPTHTTVLYTNHLPRVGSNDKGTWRRLVVAPFLANIPNPRPGYGEELIKNSSGAVLKWILDGAKQFIAMGFILPECRKVDEAIGKYKEDNDWLMGVIPCRRSFFVLKIMQKG